LTAGGLGQDLVGGLGPGEWLAAVVPIVNEYLDGDDEFFGRGVGAAADCLAIGAGSGTVCEARCVGQ